MSGALTDGDLPGFWQDADAASMRGQRWALVFTRLRLGGSLVAALGGALSWEAGRLDLAAVVILVGFVVTVVAEVVAWTEQPERLWFDGRALAESAKTMAWRYAVGADPFPLTMPAAEAERQLRTGLRDIVREVSDRIVFSSDDAVVTPAMRALREAPFEQRRRAYVEGRTEDQRAWYARKADANRRLAAGWRIALVVAEMVAVVLAAVRLLGGWHVDLAGLLAAGIAAGAAWVAVKQFTPLASAYSVAAAELGVQAGELRSATEAGWAGLAAGAEEAISREHTLWLASHNPSFRRP